MPNIEGERQCVICKCGFVPLDRGNVNKCKVCEAKYADAKDVKELQKEDPRKPLFLTRSEVVAMIEDSVSSLRDEVLSLMTEEKKDVDFGNVFEGSKKGRPEKTKGK